MTANYFFITVIVIVTMMCLLHSPAALVDRVVGLSIVKPPILLNVKEKFIIPGKICSEDEEIS